MTSQAPSERALEKDADLRRIQVGVEQLTHEFVRETNALLPRRPRFSLGDGPKLAVNFCGTPHQLLCNYYQLRELRLSPERPR